MTEEIGKTDARQGRSGTRVFTILMAGLAICAVTWLIIELIWK